MSILKAEALTVQYGSFRAVDNISVGFEKGKLTSIIGPNGAGKTTFFNALTGYSPAQGKVILEGQDISALPIYAKVRRGLTRTFQILNIFDDLTVRQNIQVAVQRRFGYGWNVFVGSEHYADVGARTSEILGLIELSDKGDVPTRELSHGHRRLVEIGVALGAEPKVLLLDEPMSGLGMYDSHRIGDFIQGLSEQMTVVLVEHHMSVVLKISDRILVINRGQLIAQGTPDEIQTNPAVQEAYLGKKVVEGADS